ncbi:hypothetical protein ACOAOT_09040 [Lacrimispora sp. AGF001]|uniref:hypothetical protein n=1 Tax=Lacrimispora sp. AGF001 TaxID=3401631 RepID=UPI003B42EB5C
MNNLVIKTNTKFMEEFQISSFCQSSGKLTSFSPESDNEITYFSNGYENFTEITTDQNSDTGFTKRILPYHGSNLCVGKAGDGRLILLYTRSEELFCVQEETVGSRKFLREIPISMPLPTDTDKIYSILIQPLEQGFAAGIIAHCKSNNLYYLIYGLWLENVPVFKQLPNGFVNPCGVFQGKTQETLRFTVWDKHISEFQFSQGKWLNYTISDNISPSLMASAQFDEQHSCLFASGKTASGYIFAYIEQNPATLTAAVNIIDYTDSITDLQTIVYINPYESYQREIHVLALSDKKNLMHCRIRYNKNDSIYYYSTLNDLGFEQVESISFVKNNPIDLEAYISFTDHKKIMKISYGFLTSLWNEEEITIPKETYMQSLSGYSTEFIFQDDQGIPYPNLSVNLWSNDISRAKINDIFYLLSLQNKIQISTDSNGKIKVFQPTLELASSALVINVPSLMPLGKTYVMKPSVVVKKQLEYITPEQLLDAKKSDGTYLLDDQHRQYKTAEDLSKSLQKFTHLTNSAESSNFNSQLFLCDENMLQEASYFQCDAQPDGWRIILDHGNISYSDISAEETNAYFETLQFGYDNSAKSFFGRIGDFIKKIGKKVVDTVVIVGQKILNAIKLAAEFIVDGIKYVFNEIINIAEQALEMAQIILRKVGVFFNDIFQWIGDIVNWDTILRYKKAISYTLDQAFSYLDYSSVALSALLTEKVQELQSKLHDYFTYIAQLVSDESVGSILKKPKDNEELEVQISNNFLMDRCLGNINQLEMIDSIEYSAESAQNIQDIFDELIKNSENMQSRKAFQEASDYFSSITKDKKNIFGKLMAGILKTLEGVMQFAGDIICNVIQLVFTGIRIILNSIRSLINARIKIPFLSDLYKYISKDELTFSDLISLILALPVSGYCRVAFHENLMPNDDALEKFKRDISFKQLFMGGNYVKAVPQKSQNALNAISGISSFSFYYLTALGDYLGIPKPTLEQVENVQKITIDPLSILCCLSETIWQICCSPFWFADKPVDVDIVCWSYCWMGLSMDYIITYVSGRYTDFSEFGRVLTVIYGVGHLAESICARIGNESSGASAHLTNFIPSIVETSKFCFLKSLLIATESISGYIGVAIDCFGGSGIALAYSGIFGYEEKHTLNNYNWVRGITW